MGSGQEWVQLVCTAGGLSQGDSGGQASCSREDRAQTWACVHHISWLGFSGDDTWPPLGGLLKAFVS